MFNPFTARVSLENDQQCVLRGKEGPSLREGCPITAGDNDRDDVDDDEGEEEDDDDDDDDERRPPLSKKTTTTKGIATKNTNNSNTHINFVIIKSDLEI